MFLLQRFVFIVLFGLSLPSLGASISKEAKSVIAKVHVAAKKQDTAALKALMVSNFVWSFGGDGDAVQAINSWQEDKAAFKHLYSATGKECAQKAEQSIECPKKAGIRLSGWF